MKSMTIRIVVGLMVGLTLATVHASADEFRPGGRFKHPSTDAITRHPSAEAIRRHPTFGAGRSPIVTSRGRTISVIRGHGRRSSTHRHRGHHSGLRVGGYLTVRYKSDHLSIGLSTGSLSFSNTRSYHGFLGGIRCRHGNYYCTLCRERLVVYPVNKAGRTFYYFRYDDGVYDDFYLVPSEKVTGSVLRDRPAVRYPQPNEIPVVVQSRPAPTADDFSSNLSPLFGGPGRVEASFALGEERFLAGRYADALGPLERAVEASPGEPAPKMVLALAYAGTGDHRRAMRMLRRGVLLLGGWPEAKVDPQDAFGSTSNYLQVRSTARRYSLGHSDDIDALMLLGYLHYLGDQYYHAGVYLERAERAGVEDATSLALLQVVRERIDYVSAP